MWPFQRKKNFLQSGILTGLADCHSHLLPGVDDGVQTLEETLVILHLMEEAGVRKLWLTPHIMEDIPNETAFLQARFAELTLQYRGTIELNLAAEYMLDNLFEERLAADDLLPLDEGKRYLLVETSYFNPPMGLQHTLHRIQQKGYYPLLAHPERYVYMQLKDYRQLHDAQVSFQLNLPSLVGLYGKEAQAKAKNLLQAGLYHRVGSDTHHQTFYQRMLEEKIADSQIQKLKEIITY